ncbi:rod shape-determining protein MreC [Parasaccharibacter sp. TMW2.1882]|uniref:Rod shape-determining protein MreC n=2 Tax=Acetobacteraceae TaxID=433 RepID=A0A7U7J1Q2_9PROT|nr:MULTISPECIES: rod shape-determining protein MreC [Acetobacteraceae]MBE1722908.1 rod shape-determining protein MreC [Bombella apis]MBR9730715.1 rod shape-determining protein MreC [Bombella apis]MCK8636399.1 rod shape-determining protein MreC [Parasaccharibacter sp. TMW2.1885]MCL1496562.1 rod shape-determining protein MreC [Parasaccharibacter sp. TMW2.1882]MCL1513010.1 rod shape-determining protein MreC [Parasaccharibacter sp. TMW 2.1891]
MVSIHTRQLLSGLVLPVMVFLAVGTVLAGQIWPGRAIQIRMAAAQKAGAIYQVLLFPQRQFHEWQITLQGVGDLLAANAQLRQENQKLAYWHGEAQTLRQENARLKAVLHWGAEDTRDYVSGWVVRDESGPYLRAVLLQVGEHRVQQGSLAVDSFGLVGRVSEVGPHVVRVLLIEDAASRIPVTLQSSGGDAMMIGDNTPYPRLMYYNQSLMPEEGEHIVTRGQTGLTGGVAVGHVHYLAPGQPVVIPDAALGKLELVRIFDGGFTLEAPPSAGRVREKPPLLPDHRDGEAPSNWQNLRRFLPFSSLRNG